MDITGLLLGFGGAGAVLSVLIELLKKTSFPTEKPKLIAVISALVITVIVNLIAKDFTIDNLDVMAASVAEIALVATGVYEYIIRPIKERYFVKK